jgi:small subunit ribosomal protein S20
MATHKSAKKRARQDLVRRARNRDKRSRVRRAIRAARAAIEAGDSGSAATAVRQAESLMRRATSKGVLHRKTTSRQISRLAKAAHSL